MPTIVLIVTLILIALLAVITILETYITARIVRAESKQRLLSDQSISCHSSQGWVGCSVICSRVNDIGQIENLLSTTYNRYEVIAIIDSWADDELFSKVISQYMLIELNTPKHRQNNDGGIRSLYRSGQRRYRHLVLLDISQSIDTYERLNLALEVASYNYVLPIAEAYHLRPRAIESIAITLSDAAEQEIEMVQSLSDIPCQIFRYDTVVSKSGFSTDLPRKIASDQILYTYETYFCKSDRKHSTKRNLRLEISLRLAVIAILGGIITLIVSPKTLLHNESGAEWQALWTLLIICAILSTIITIRAISTHQIAACGIAKCSDRTMLCYFRRLVAIFSRRKFIIS